MAAFYSYRNENIERWEADRGRREREKEHHLVSRSFERRTVTFGRKRRGICGYCIVEGGNSRSLLDWLAGELGWLHIMLTINALLWRPWPLYSGIHHSYPGYESSWYSSIQIMFAKNDDWERNWAEDTFCGGKGNYQIELMASEARAAEAAIKSPLFRSSPSSSPSSFLSTC